MTENKDETEHEETNDEETRIDRFGHPQRPHNPDGSPNLSYPRRSCAVCVFRTRGDGRPCAGRHRHEVVLRGEVCLDFRVGTPEVKESPPAAVPTHTRIQTKRFSFDGVKWICSKCDYTSPSKETMKSHHRRQHLPLPDRTIETNPRRKSPQLDAKFDGEDSGGLD